MAEIEPQSLEELEDAVTAFEALVSSGLAEVIAQVIEESGIDDAELSSLTPADVDRITALWEAYVVGTLLPFLAVAMSAASEETAQALMSVLGAQPFLNEPLDT